LSETRTALFWAIIMQHLLRSGSLKSHFETFLLLRMSKHDMIKNV